VDSTDVARLTWLTQSREVVVLYWPAQADEAQRLDRQCIPHLLLVDSGSTPPSFTSCLGDWMTLPASDLELQTRLVNLAQRAASHPRPPIVDDLGQLTYRGRSLFVSPIDQQLLHVLVESFGAIVTEAALIEKVWPEGAKNQVLRVHLSRLRRRLAPLGLTIKCARNAGYVMAEAEPMESTVAVG
jgi:Transcriptional regulatory protein, C terminal